jgi:hypothetical protein
MMKKLKWLLSESLFQLGCACEWLGRKLDDLAGAIHSFRRRLP